MRKISLAPWLERRSLGLVWKLKHEVTQVGFRTPLVRQKSAFSAKLPNFFSCSFHLLVLIESFAPPWETKMV